MEHQVFLRQLESHSLPASDFNHQAHLYAAWGYRREYPAPEAAARCAHALSRFAMANGAATKYNHTLTMALLAIAYSRIESSPALGGDWPAFLDCCSDLAQDARAVLEQYYSAERLMADSARKAFVKPDKQPLPVSCLLN
ncbi:hypothetical protein KIF53_18855 [Chromobacterium subtsugae]|uniref:Uncharacterized protein n=1 Tax=Chromobacterium subtsugae TaxID=251747 RepID=A0ABS7FHY3_9NEIS|nr:MULTISPECIES: hypothetical protein [Chromobacterium]KUM04808.1 hypothetical protein Cv017_12450 [Chromobacterium subtsugae]KZE84742.1 hypothetical protein AWB61_04960 [Chromobacterium sp. F49]MBW7567428.1 hypothetical protein [Chromobacterium subtsugae]MBW8289698.1 hypothetical protein [Chromobacterium subtsugae]OBU84866.1 hypothetical protein MY55_19380 [Chromobacterium subtsugae]